MSTKTLKVDDLRFELRWSTRRKTTEISVERQGELVIRAPEGTDESRIRRFVRDKKFWIYQELAKKEARNAPKASKEYVNGEGFPYLGRSYRLLIVEEQHAPLLLKDGRFKLRRAGLPEARSHFVRWYTEHALPWLEKRVARWAPRVGAEPTKVAVRDLGYRWGSCSASGAIQFHWATILLRPALAEYVVAHELVHLLVPDHSVEYWKALERVMPEYRRRKTELASEGNVTHRL